MKKTAALTARIFIYSFCILLTFNACKTSTSTEQVDSGLAEEILAIQNTDATLWNATSAEWHLNCIQAYQLASYKLRLKHQQDFDNQLPKAVVLDLDETVLDNSPYFLDQIKKGQTFNKKSWASWCDKANAKAIPGSIEFINLCKQLNIEVFFISNRSIETLRSTTQNLGNIGIETNQDHILLKEGESDKTNRRQLVNERFHTILYIGDNLRDFSEIYKDRKVDFGRALVEEDIANLKENFVLVANPIYGDWRSLLYGTDAKLNASDKLQNIQKILNTPD